LLPVLLPLLLFTLFAFATFAARNSSQYLFCCSELPCEQLAGNIPTVRGWSHVLRSNQRQHEVVKNHSAVPDLHY